MINKNIKIEVIKLRRKGKTYKEINNILGIKIPKSTLSYWCKSVKLSNNLSSKIKNINLQNLKKAREKAIKVNKENRKKYLNNLYFTNKNLKKLINNRDNAKLILACLYLGEGGKRQKGSIMFGNSDPKIISLFLKLLRFIYKVDKNKFRCTLQGRDGQNIKKLEKFWSTVTDIPPNQFYKARIDKRTFGKKMRKADYKGVCRIDYFSADIHNELLIIGKIICDF